MATRGYVIQIGMKIEKLLWLQTLATSQLEY